MQPLAQADVPVPAMPNSEAEPNPVLLGPDSNPEEVTILQRQLTELGFYAGPMDGAYSSALQEAVKAFQASVNLPATGLLDRQTWDRMSTPQLLSGASTPQGAAEVPNLLPSSPDEPLPSADSASVDASAAVPPPGTDPAPPAETTSPAESPPTPQPASPAADALARAPWPWQWLLALPVAVVAMGGIGWVWRRLRRSDPPLRTAPQSLSGEIAPGETEEAIDPEPSAGQAMVPPSWTEPGAETPSGQAPEPAIRGQDARFAQRSEVARLPTVNIVETLVNELSSADTSVRQRAIWELGQRGNSTAIQPLVNSLMEADSQEKSLIFAALTEIGRRSLQPMQGALALGLQDPSPEVRKNALRDLSRLYESLGQMSPLLIHATQDPDPEVQAIAQWALGQLARLAPSPYLEVSVDPLSPGDRLPPASP